MIASHSKNFAAIHYRDNAERYVDERGEGGEGSVNGLLPTVILNPLPFPPTPSGPWSLSA